MQFTAGKASRHFWPSYKTSRPWAVTPGLAFGARESFTGEMTRGILLRECLGKALFRENSGNWRGNAWKRLVRSACPYPVQEFTCSGYDLRDRG